MFKKVPLPHNIDRVRNAWKLIDDGSIFRAGEANDGDGGFTQIISPPATVSGNEFSAFCAAFVENSAYPASAATISSYGSMEFNRPIANMRVSHDVLSFLTTPSTIAKPQINVSAPPAIGSRDNSRGPFIAHQASPSPAHQWVSATTDDSFYPEWDSTQYIDASVETDGIRLWGPPPPRDPLSDLIGLPVITAPLQLEQELFMDKFAPSDIPGHGSQTMDYHGNNYSFSLH